MNDDIRNTISTYRRTLETRKANTVFYSLLLILTLVIYGFFGVRSFSGALREKHATLNDLRILNQNLQTKLESIASTRAVLLEATPYTEELKKRIPVEPRVEGFVVSLVDQAASSGYVQNSLTVQREEKTTSLFRASFSGPPENFGSFISAVEDNERLSVIETVEFSERENIANVDMMLQIFYLERKQ